MKTIWIFNHYATGSYFDRDSRHYNFAKNLAKNGYKVIIFCASTVHNSDENLITDKRKFYQEEISENISFVFVKARSYENNGLKRILNMFDYYKGLKKLYKLFPKPYCIIGSSVHPLACLAALKISKKLRCKNVLEIRDLWPLSIVEYTRLTNKNIIIKLLYCFEKSLYKRADKLIFTMAGGSDYIKDKKWDNKIDLNKVYHINNGVDLEKFDSDCDNFKIDDSDLKDGSVKNIVYCGSVRPVNNLGLLLDCAKELKDKQPDVKFLIYGKGTDLERLKKRQKDEGIDNVVFKGFVEKQYVPYIIRNSFANIITLPQTSLMKYGCSFNKLFYYLAAGKPILSNVKTEYDLIEEYGCGFVTADQSSQSLLEAVERLSALSYEEYQGMSRNSRKCAEEYDFQVLTKKLEEIIEG